jgi:hypothetical protein
VLPIDTSLQKYISLFAENIYSQHACQIKDYAVPSSK